MSTSEQAAEQTRAWVKNFIIGLNLCPFAKVPFDKDQIRFEVAESDGFEEIYRELLSAFNRLFNADAKETETSLFVVPAGLDDFEDYLDMLDAANQAIEDSGLEGTIQLASFHPNYCFDGVDYDDPANFSNRSPYPMFHLIREASLEQALKNYPNPEEIPERNVALLRDMGEEKIREIIQAD